MPRLSNNRQSPQTDAPRAFRLVGGRVTPRTVAPTPPAPTVPLKAAPSAERIRQLAYYKWEAAGSPPGDGATFWLAAERELAGRS